MGSHANTNTTTATDLYHIATNNLPHQWINSTATCQTAGTGKTLTYNPAGTFATDIIGQRANNTSFYTITFAPQSRPAGVNLFQSVFQNLKLVITNNDPQITLNSTSGIIGSTIQINGTNFGAATNTAIYLNGINETFIGHIGTSFSKNFQIPAGTPVGVSTINATDTTAPHKTDKTTFTVLSGTLVLNSTNGNVGKTILASGSGFTHSSATQFKYDTHVLSTNPLITSTTSTGTFSGVTFVIPSSTAGHHNVNVTDGNGNIGTKIYNVTSSLIVSPSSGSPASTPTISGYGFLASKNMTIKFDGVILTPVFGPTTSTDTTGTFSTQAYNIPSTTAGTHTFNATEGSHFALATFTITPTVTITPSSGTVNTHESSLGSGFAATSALTIKFDGTALTTSPASPKTDHLGQFNNTLFYIPSASGGIHTIRIQDASGNFVDTSYTITTVSGFSLSYSSISQSTITLNWLTPVNIGGEIVKGYQINYTTPHGTPKTVITNNTGTTITSFTISGLSNNTAYSFRVGEWTNGTSNKNMTNILDVTTLPSSSGTTSGPPPNITPGQITLNPGTNPIHVPFSFLRQDTSSSTMNLYVGYPSTYNTTCNFNYQFANVNKTYSNLTTNPNGTGRVNTLFQFTGVGNDIINVICTDVKTNTTGHYALTQVVTQIPMVQQIQKFEAGGFGTAGQFGAFDFIELIVLILSMIGLNQVDQKVGAIIMVIVLGALAFFHIGSFPVIIFSAIAMVLILVVPAGRKALQ